MDWLISYQEWLAIISYDLNWEQLQKNCLYNDFDLDVTTRYYIIIPVHSLFSHLLVTLRYIHVIVRITGLYCWSDTKNVITRLNKRFNNIK